MHSYDREPLELDLELALRADFAPMLALRGIVAVGAAASPGSSAAGRRALRRRAAATAAYARRRSRADRPRARRRRTRCASRSTCRRAASETIELAYALHEGDEPPPRRERPAARAARAPLAELARRPHAVVTDDELFDRVLRRSLLDVRMLHARLTARLLHRRPPVVRDAVRAGLAHLRDAAARLRPAAWPSRRCACSPACSAARRPRPRRGAGQGAARAARGEIAHLGLTPFAPLLRHRRRDAALPLPALRLRRLERRPRAVPRAAPAGRGDAGLDRRAGRPRRRRPARLRLAHAARPPQPGLEGLGRRDPRRARRAARAADHARRAAGVRAARQARPRAPVRARRRRGGGRRLRAEAAALRERLERFWLPEHGYYSMGSAPTAARARALASNQGHLLWGRAVPPGARRRRSATR